MEIKTAIIAVAGVGVRLLPWTKVMQKEMRPIFDRPFIDYVVDDCIQAGVEKIIFVVNERNSQIQDYYSEDKDLYEYLSRSGKLASYDRIKNLHTKADFHFVVQTSDDAYGTATPVLKASSYIEHDEAFFVLMGENYIYNKDRSSDCKKMIECFQESGSSALASFVEVEKKDISRYGVADICIDSGIKYLKGIVEKPDINEAPSNFANFSRYIFTPEIIDIIRNQQMNPIHHELQITDSISTLCQKSSVVAYIASGQPLDCGNSESWLQANLLFVKGK